MRRAALTAAVLLALLAGPVPALWALVRGFRGDDGWTLDAARAILADGGAWGPLGWTVAIAVAGALGAFLLGLPFALFTARLRVPGHRVLSAAYVAPLVLPPLLLALSLDGLAPAVFRTAGEDGGSLPFRAFLAAGLFALAGFPLPALFARRALAAPGASLEEAGLLAGGSAWTLRRVTLPLALPGAALGAMFVFVFALNDFAVVDYLNLAAPPRSQVPALPYLVQVCFSRKTGDLRDLLVLSLPVAVISTTVLLWTLGRALRADGAVVGSAWRPARPLPAGPAVRWCGTAFCTLLLAVAVVLPAGYLLHASGGVEGIRRVFATSPGHGGAVVPLRLTLGLAAGAVALAVPAALVLGEAARRAGPGTRMLVAVAATLPLALVPSLVPLGALSLWNQPFLALPRGDSVWNPVTDTPVLGALVLFSRVMPMALAAVWASLREVETGQFEAAESAGVPWDLRLTRIVLPLARPGVVLGALLAFVFAVRELDGLAVIPEAQTLIRRAWNDLHFGRDGDVAAMGLVLLALLATAFGLAGASGMLGGRQPPPDAASRSSAPS